MKKEGKNRNKNISGVAGGAAILVIAIIVLMATNPMNKTKESTPLEKGNFEFIDYTFLNEDQIKSECAYIRVGRCDAIGGELGGDCWMKPAQFNYNLNGVSPEGITCTAKNQNGIDRFAGAELSEEGIYQVTVNVDVRQYNKIDVCCTNSATQKEACLDPVEIEGIC